MTIESALPHQEKEPQAIIVPPAGEGLINFQKESFWSEDIINNPELRKQASIRKELASSIQTVFDLVPVGMEIEHAFDSGLIETGELVALYENASKLLETDPDSNRFILYFPFEIIPSKKLGNEDIGLNHSKDKFTHQYLKAWHSLLNISDVSANFEDGDFSDTEMETQEFPRVVKAAHLVPLLLEKELINFQYIHNLILENQDSLLSKSLYEGLAIASGSGILATYEEKAFELLAESFAKQDVSKLDEPYPISDTRKEWLEQEGKRHHVEHASSEIVGEIKSGSLTPQEFKEEYLLTGDLELSVIGVYGFRKFIEYAKTEDNQRTVEIYSEFEPDLIQLWSRGGAEVQDALLSMWSYFITLKIVDRSSLVKLNIWVPTLVGEVLNRRKDIEKDLKKIKSCMDMIASDEMLSKYVYPISMLYGSRLKGYGTNQSDSDIAIFIQPGVSIENRYEIREAMAKIFARENINTKPIEFWLDEDMSIQDFLLEDTHLGSSRLVDVLFSGVMCGEETAIREVYDKVLPHYLYSKGKKELDGKFEARKIWLEEFERNILQYRLMHRGYEHFHPKQGKKHNPNGNAFWDAGYRRLASKLYVEKVFLPQL